MKTEQTLMYIGAVVLVIFGFYSLVKMFKLQTSVVEGFLSNSNNITDIITKTDFPNLKEEIQKQEDVLRIDKYRTKYEDMLIDFDEYLNGVLLQELVQTTDSLGTSEPDSEKMDGIIKNLNQIYELKDNLNSTMKYVDSKKSSKTGLF